MRRALILSVVFAALYGCGQVAPELRVSKNGMHAEAFGHAKCECGEQHMLVLGRTHETIRLRCERCKREWIARLP